MESASIAATHDHEHHGPPEAHESSRIDRQTLGILLFIVSEVMLFGSFFAAYFFISVVANVGPWPPDGLTLPVSVAGVNTAILVSSSFTIHWALESIRRENRRGLIMGLAATFMLGATFLFIQINEYAHIGFAPHTNAFGSVFYGLTGLHDAQVLLRLLREHPSLARPFLEGAEEAPGRRGAGDLLALRRRHVDHRLHHGLHPLETSLASVVLSSCASRCASQPSTMSRLGP